MKRIIFLILLTLSHLSAEEMHLNGNSLNPVPVDTKAYEEYQQKNLLESIKRDEMGRKQEQLAQSQSGEVIKVAILGNSAADMQEGFNESVLRDLLKNIKKQNPAAVFFTGNMIYALATESPTPTSQLVDLSTVKNIFGQKVWVREGYFDLALYQKRLAHFAAVVKEELGSTPFYPAMGEIESLDPAALKVFVEQFNIPNAQILEPGQLVYSVVIGNTFFAVIATDSLIEGQIQHKLAPATAQWIDTIFQEEAAKKSRFRFAIGNDPAYSATGTFGIFAGLDKDSEERDRSWNRMKKYEVMTYFSGNDILYDRSYRYGVWQINTGGAGATIDFEGVDETFYHTLLLTIPQKGTSDPVIQVFDREGKKKDDQALTKEAPAINNFRIVAPI